MTRCHETCVLIGIRNKACLLNKEDDGARGRRQMPWARLTKSASSVGCSCVEPSHPSPSVGHHDPYKPLRMTDSSSIDNELGSLAPTAASILGIKGPLRFRPHGSSQKAHVVLRRVDPESDSEGEGETKGAVQFSLFAYKRIEVKPGKEILLTVADGPFKDRAIIFEGDELGAPSLSDVEEETQVAEDDDAFVPPEQSLPLKMRKPWAKRLEVSVPLGTCDVSISPLLRHSLVYKAHTSHPRASRHSLGVQTDPVNITTTILATLTDPPPVPEASPQTINPTLARRGSKTFPLDALSSSVPSSPLHGVKVGLPPATKTAAPKMGAVHPRDAERDHSLSSMKVDSITSSSIPSSVDIHHPTSSAPAKQDANVCAHLEVDHAAAYWNRVPPTLVSMVS